MKTLYTKSVVFNLLFLICLTRPRAQAESPYNYPEIGKHCPDFELNGIVNYAVKKASLKDFKGQWIILEFWSSHCVSCLKRMPELDSLQKKFRKQIQFILVGYNGEKEDKPIRNLYEKYRIKYNLNLVNAYDSALFDRLGVGAVPPLFWIDNKVIE